MFKSYSHLFLYAVLSFLPLINPSIASEWRSEKVPKNRTIAWTYKTVSEVIAPKIDFLNVPPQIALDELDSFFPHDFLPIFKIADNVNLKGKEINLLGEKVDLFTVVTDFADQLELDMLITKGVIVLVPRKAKDETPKDDMK